MMPLAVRWPGTSFARGTLASAALGLVIILASSACRNDAQSEPIETAYASEASGPLRDQLGPKSRVIATVPSGRKLLVLERMNRWARVRVDTAEQEQGKPPLEGWMHQRQMVSQQVVNQFEALAEESSGLPSQGGGMVRRLANLRLQPGRTTQTFYQLAADEPLEALRHAVVSREATAEEVRRGSSEPIPEDWLLVRASKGRTGWVLESLVEVIPPPEVARYRESQRIRAWFELYREQSSDGAHPWYLWASVPRLSGSAHEIEEIRVFVWNPQASRYETSYRERNLKGFLPITVTRDGGEQSASPAFSFEHQNAQGERLRRIYYMVGRQVRLKRE
jgi:hypothetical protein